MTHCLIIGQTLSGKSTLARTLAHTYSRGGVSSLIFDPIGETRWRQLGTTYQSFPVFLEEVKRQYRCALFIDEAAIAYSENGNDMQILATTIRHWGHRSHFICQRYTGIPPTMRDQCSYLYLFNTSAKDGVDLAREWNQPTLEQCNTLERGEYFAVQRLGQVKKGNVFA